MRVLCVCTCIYMSAFMCLHMEVRGQPWALVFFSTLRQGPFAVFCCVHHASWPLSELGCSCPCLSSHCKSTGILDMSSSPWHYVCPEVFLPKDLMLVWQVILSTERSPQPQIISLASILEMCCSGTFGLKTDGWSVKTKRWCPLAFIVAKLILGGKTGYILISRMLFIRTERRGKEQLKILL